MTGEMLTGGLALVLMAVGQNVVTFCAAQVFYWVGMNGVDYVIKCVIPLLLIVEHIR